MPFHLMTELGTKPLPFTVIVNALPPAVMTVGVTMLTDGTGLPTTSVSAADVPPTGGGDTTVTEAVPGFAMSTAVIAAVSWLASTNVVARSVPFQWTTELGTKSLPLTDKVNAGPPAMTDAGESDATVGAGFGLGAVPLSELQAAIATTKAMIPTGNGLRQPEAGPVREAAVRGRRTPEWRPVTTRSNL